MISLDTNKSFKDNYKILIGSILPRPIAAVSTRNSDGSFNLAPFSFFTGVSASPMIVAFCPMIRSSDGKKKDTLINIEREKEFVVNIVTEDLAQKINQCSTELPYGQDEFLYSGLTPLPSVSVQAPRIKEGPIHLECRLRDILSYGEHLGAGHLVTGEVLKAHIAEEIYDKGHIITQKMRPVGRGAGNDWFKTDHVFEMTRLMKEQIQK